MNGREGFWFFDVQGCTLQTTPATWNGGNYVLETTAAVTLNITT